MSTPRRENVNDVFQGYCDLAPFPGLIPSPLRRSASSLRLREWGDGRVSDERARGFRYQVSLRVDHEISVQDFTWEGGIASARSAAADLPGKGSGDRTRRGVPGSHPHAGVVPSEICAGQVGAVPEGAVLAEAARRVSRVAEKVLGPAPVGAGILLRECGRGGRGYDQGVHRKSEVG